MKALNYQKKPVAVRAVQVFQKDIEAAFELEKDRYKKEQEEKNKTSDKPKYGSLSGCYTEILVDGVRIYLSRHFDKGGTREWYITARLGEAVISDGNWVCCTPSGKQYVETDSDFKRLYEEI